MNIFIKKNNFVLIDDNFFLVKKGKVALKYIFEDGKVINCEFFLEENDISGNFFSHLDSNSIFYKEVTLEIQALEDTSLELIDFNFKNEIYSSQILKQIFEQLLKQLIIKCSQQLYSQKEFIQWLFLEYSEHKKEIPQNFIHHNNFNLSRSQFYNLKIKKDLIKNNNLKKT